MTTSNQAEWLCLQQSYDKAEQLAAWLKVIVCLSWLWLVVTDSGIDLQLAAISLFWLQEAILRTQQTRTEHRLLQLEVAIRESRDEGCQWYSQWQQQRGGAVMLAKSYISSACKPTVALLYVLLGILSLLTLA